MEKSTTLNLRVNPTLKANAEEILSQLGIPMSTAVDMFLNQIVLVGGIPFPVRLPQAADRVDASRMSEDEIHEKILKGYEDYRKGNVQDAAEAFRKFSETHK